MSTRTMAMIFGIVFLIVGAGGFFLLDAASPPAELKVHNGYGNELGLFPVNVVHNIIHILFGLWGLLASRSLGGSVGYFRAVAIIYAVLTVMGLAGGAISQTFGLAPLHGNDVWLHALLALVGAYFGWMHRDRGTADRV